MSEIVNEPIAGEIPESVQNNEQILKELEAKVKAQEIPPEMLAAFPPQGTTAPKIARTLEDLARINPPDPIKEVIYLDEKGNLLPQWVQVARMYNRPVKKVAIVGFADTRIDAPYNDPTFEIWGLNDLHNQLPRYDRWFDIHDRENINEDVRLGRSPADKCGLGGLSRLNVPVYMQDHYPDIPNSIKFPLDEVIKAFPYGHYMTNSISYMIALAIYEGFTEIHVYGVDMAVGPEYIAQRPSCEYWLGVVAGKGIKLYIPSASDLLKCHCLYAFESRKQNLYEDKLRRTSEEMVKRKAQIDDQLRQGQQASWQYEGAIGALNEMKKVWANLDTKL